MYLATCMQVLLSEQIGDIAEAYNALVRVACELPFLNSNDDERGELFQQL